MAGLRTVPLFVPAAVSLSHSVFPWSPHGESAREILVLWGLGSGRAFRLRFDLHEVSPAKVAPTPATGTYAPSLSPFWAPVFALYFNCSTLFLSCQALWVYREFKLEGPHLDVGHEKLETLNDGRLSRTSLDSQQILGRISRVTNS